MKTDPVLRVSPNSRRIVWAPLLTAGVLILVFGAVLLCQVEQSVFGRVPILDEVYYLDRAAEISGGNIIPSDPYFMSPVYPYLVAALGAGGGVPEDRVFSGSELRGLRLFQFACWLGTLLLIKVMAGRVVPDDWRGRWRTIALWLPVVLFALYRPATVYAMAVLLEAPLLFLLTLTMALMTGLNRNSSWWVTLLLGVVLGLAGLLRGTVLLVAPVVLLALWRCGVSRRNRVLGTAWVLLGLTLVLAPPVLHNSRLAGRLVGPSLNGGVNLYIGNGPEANGFYVAAVPGDWRHDPAGRAFLADRFERSDVSLAVADRLWSLEAWYHMKSDPGRVLRLVARKIWLQLQGWEIDQLTPLAGWMAQVPILHFLVTPYALLVGLGLAGAAVLRGQQTVGLLIAAIVVLILGQSLFFVVSRYRLVLAPLWATLAGVGTVHLIRRNRVALVVGVAAIVLTVPWGLNDVRESWVALAQANEAVRWADVGVADKSRESLLHSESLYRQSLAVEDDRPASWLGLAAVLGNLDRPQEKGTALRTGLAKVAQPLELQKTLLAHELAQGRPQMALAVADSILAMHPREADTLHNMSVLLARIGRPDGALTAAEQLRSAHPADPRGHVDVGVLLARSGRRDDAISVFRRGLVYCPDHPDLVRNLALLEP